MRARLRAVAVAAVVVGAWLAVPAAAARTATLTVRAARSGFTLWDVPAGTSVDLYASTATGTGSYAGYYLQPEAKGGDIGLGYVWLKAFEEPAFTRFPMPLNAPPQPPRAGEFRQWKLPAGRYRVHVFGDGATRARLVFSGRAAGGTRSVTRPTQVSAVTKELPDVLPSPGVPVPDAAVAQQPVTVRSNALSFAAVFSVFRGLVQEASLRHACLGRATELPCATDPRPDTARFKYWQGRLQWPHNHSVYAAAWYYYPGALAAGEQTARYELAAATGLQRAVGAAFTIAL